MNDGYNYNSILFDNDCVVPLFANEVSIHATLISYLCNIISAPNSIGYKLILGSRTIDDYNVHKDDTIYHRLKILWRDLL